MSTGTGDLTGLPVIHLERVDRALDIAIKWSLEYGLSASASAYGETQAIIRAHVQTSGDQAAPDLREIPNDVLRSIEILAGGDGYWRRQTEIDDPKGIVRSWLAAIGGAGEEGT